MRKTARGLTALVSGIMVAALPGCSGVASKLGYMPEEDYHNAVTERDKSRKEYKSLSSDLETTNKELTSEQEKAKNLQIVVKEQIQQIEGLEKRKKYCIPITVDGVRHGWATQKGARLYYDFLAEIAEVRGQSLTNMEKKSILLATDSYDGKRDGILTDESIEEAYGNSADEIIRKYEKFIATYLPSEKETSAGIAGVKAMGDGIEPGKER